MKNSNRYILWAWLPPLLWASVIFIFSSIPTFPTDTIIWWDFILKKTAHIVEFGILFILTFRAVNITFGYKTFNKSAAFYVLLFCIIYGASDEFHQSFTPGRTPHIRDVGFDTVGALLALWYAKRSTWDYVRTIIYQKGII